VGASLPGASAETMAASVATRWSASSRPFRSGFHDLHQRPRQHQRHLQFDLDRNLDGAALDVQAAIVTAQGRLPAGMPNPPTFRKVNPADMPILNLVLSSSTLPLSVVDEFGETTMRSASP